MVRMREQSIKSGARVVTKTVDSVDLSVHPFKVFVGTDIYETKTLILATGATAKRMHLLGEDLYRQR